ncbi:hydrogenase [Dethiosulfovibrio salsuginis]|uniref:Hydrogenase n=1 Tax=Dethiosulfovibrio salsuginis TaxID=561720 RepID=A0A1X7JMD8_9BACT|nr:hydrogenase [Dethiosulfovibrio salsuginis]SMG28588.1 hypothetical protein SAMN06275492_11319 [Dethiosulfovibrio salsuginis]
MFGSIFTGFGFWDFGSWITFFLIALGISLWLRSQGRQDYKKGTEQDQIYFSGNDIPDDPEEVTVPASSSYWGFRKAFKPYYDRMVAFHSGNMSEYVGWFVMTTAIVLIIAIL